MKHFEVPVIDLAAFATDQPHVRQSLARAVDDAFTTSGFLTIVNHGVPSEVIENAKREARAFFAQPLDTKLVARRSAHQGRGFVPPNTIASSQYGNNKKAPTDLMEGFAAGPFRAPAWAPGAEIDRSPDGENVWPTSPPTFRPAVENYYSALEKLSLTLMRLFALALRLDADYFIPFHTPHNGVLRLNLYARLTQTPLPGQMRIGEHTDVGGFTILLADASCGGLQIRDDEDQWHDVPYRADSFVINLGEMMKTWTNDRWRATRHRVVNPRTEAENVDRLSIPYFVNPASSARIECIPTCLDPGTEPLHAPVNAGEFRQKRLAQQRTLTAVESPVAEANPS